MQQEGNALMKTLLAFRCLCVCVCVCVYAKGRSVEWGCFHWFRRCTCFLSIRGMKEGKAETCI